MRYMFKFPDIGEGITEGKILEWLVRPGQEVGEGDPLVKMETDKVVADIPSPRAGKVARLFGKVGEIANVDEALVELEIAPEAGEAADEASAAGVAEATGEETPAKVKVEEGGFGVIGEIEDATGPAFLPATGEGMEAADAASAAPARKKALATPVARAMARDLSLDINAIPGSGPGGRVMKADIRRFAEESSKAAPAAPAAPAPPTGKELEEVLVYEDLSQIRKTIAARMTESKREAPHLTAMEKVEVSELVAFRERSRAAFEAATGGGLTYLPFVIKAVCAALAEHPVLNGRLEMDMHRFVYQKFINIGVAVDSPDGLVVPVIRDADRLSIRELQAAVRDLAERGRERRLSLDEIRGSTFSITNFGSIAGTYGAPIINYPEVAILGVGRISDEPVVRDGAVVPGKVLHLSLSADHRIVDGAEAARFIKRVMDLLADPASLLLV